KSAMLQSSQVWMTKVHEPVKCKDVIINAAQDRKYIGHLSDEDKRGLSAEFNTAVNSHIILIGPEGDFTPAEIKLAIDNKFIPVSMGKTVLRVETAGLYAAAVCRG